MLIGFNNAAYFMALVGIACCGAGFYGFKQYKPETAISKFALGIELNSGRKTLFTAPDIEFVQKSARALTEAIADKGTDKEKTVINFDNKSIVIENAINSNIIGGNVSDSLVENI